MSKRSEKHQSKIDFAHASILAELKMIKEDLDSPRYAWSWHHDFLPDRSIRITFTESDLIYHIKKSHSRIFSYDQIISLYDKFFGGLKLFELPIREGSIQNFIDDKIRLIHLCNSSVYGADAPGVFSDIKKGDTEYEFLRTPDLNYSKLFNTLFKYQAILTAIHSAIAYDSPYNILNGRGE